MGVYGEIAATTLPGAKVEDTAAATTSIGFNVGVDFSSTKARFALGYASDSLSFDGGNASLGASATRVDFNLFSLADTMRIRGALGFNLGSGKSEYGGMMDNDSKGGNAFAGLGLTYFLSWKLAAHAVAGPVVASQSMPTGSLTGTGATVRVTLSYSFGDVRPDTKFFVPLNDAHDITGILEKGADALGCTSRQKTLSTYAYLFVTCRGREVWYIQIAEGIMASCQSMFKKECEAFTERLVTAAKAAVTGPATPAQPPAPTPPSPTPPASTSPTPTPPTPATPPAPPTTTAPTTTTPTQPTTPAQPTPTTP